MSDVKLKVVATATGVIATSITAALLALTKPAEGERRTAYQDPVGIPTICYGHTGPDVKLGMRATAAQCEAWLIQDLKEAQTLVDRCYDRSKLTQPQHDALTDAMFNIGPGKAGVKDGLCELKRGGWPRIRKFANSGACRAAADEFLSWSNAGGKRLPGLVKRNEARRAMYLGGCP